MEKIKITREQKEAFDVFMSNSEGEVFSGLVEQLIDKSCKFESALLKPLNDIPDEHFLYMLCGWYEVEQPFEVGDWVHDRVYHHYSKISRVGSNYYCVANRINDMDKDYAHKLCEKVTEPWKIMLLELGRDKPEFKVGDKYETIYNAHSTVKSTLCPLIAAESAKNNRIKYFYPVESRIEVKGNGGFNGTE